MKMTDEILSAFLDNELTDAEMDTVRDRLAEDPGLTDRLAELASVDTQLQAHYGAIDDRPMPEPVTRMLEDGHSPDTGTANDNVVAFPWWRRVRQHTGKAIAAAVIAGVALAQWMTLPSGGGPEWPAVASVLDSQPSGEVYELERNATLTPRLTFQNQSGEWCRQFRLDTGEAAYEQIACRQAGGAWEPVARAEAERSADPQTYQTASGGRVLDDTLDRIMTGAPVGPEQERALLQQRWAGE